VIIDHWPVTIFRWIARKTGTIIFHIGIRFTSEGALVITSHMLDTSKAAVVFAHFRSPFWLFALLLALISLVVPATAWSDIYKWTDEQGKTNFSNVPPTKPGKVKSVEIVLKEARPTPPTEQALLARIESLERQLQVRQYTTQAPAVPPPTPYGGYYPPTPPPPPPPNYYDSGYGSSYYPSYYPSYYTPSYSYAAYPARAFIGRPVFAAPRGGSFRGGGGHRGRR
jgi:hypothetical protein